MKRLAVLTAALIVAFVYAPAALAANGSTQDLTDEAGLIATFRSAFVTYWATGGRAFQPGLQRVVDYWFRYHIAKGLLAAALLVVLIALGVLIWRAFLRAGGLRSTLLLASAGATTTALAVVSLATIMANVHGAAAPFGSLLPMLFGDAGASTGALTSTVDPGSAASTGGSIVPGGSTGSTGSGGSGGSLAATLDQVRQQLTARQHSPALEVITRDYVRFHAVMAVEGTVVVALLALLSVILRRRFTHTRRSERRTRRLLAAYGIFTPLLLVALAVIVAANATTAANPQPGLEGFFAGGW
jgi:hypothetical protein